MHVVANSLVTEARFRLSRKTCADVCVPDALLPEQYFDRRASRVVDSPYKRLMFAVLLDAVIRLRGRDPKHAAEAYKWIGSTDGDGYLLSFRYVCEALGIEANYLARGLMAGREGTPQPPFKARPRQLRASRPVVTLPGRSRLTPSPAARRLAGRAIGRPSL